MFSNSQKLYVRNYTALGRWRAAKVAITTYTAVPASFSIWEFIQSPNLKLLFSYIVIIAAIVILQIICAGKVAHYQVTVDLLKSRLDHPPPDKSKDLTDGQNSTKIDSGDETHGNPG